MLSRKISAVKKLKKFLCENIFLLARKVLIERLLHDCTA